MEKQATLGAVETTHWVFTVQTPILLVELSACIKYGVWVDTSITHVGYYFTPSGFYSFADRKEKSTAPSAAFLPWTFWTHNKAVM